MVNRPVRPAVSMLAVTTALIAGLGTVDSPPAQVMERAGDAVEDRLQPTTNRKQRRVRAAKRRKAKAKAKRR